MLFIWKRVVFSFENLSFNIFDHKRISFFRMPFLKKGYSFMMAAGQLLRFSDGMEADLSLGYVEEGGWAGKGRRRKGSILKTRFLISLF